jgi:phage tail protein X
MNIEPGELQIIDVFNAKPIGMGFCKDSIGNLWYDNGNTIAALATRTYAGSNAMTNALTDINNGLVSSNTQLVISGAVYFWNGTALSRVDGASAVILLPGTGNAASNSAAIQAALNAGGLVELLQPGVYYVSPPHMVPSHTTVVIGDGVELTQVPGATFKSFFQNTLVSPTFVNINSIAFTFVPTPNPLNNGGSFTSYGMMSALVTCAAAHGLSVNDSVIIDGDWSLQANGGHVVTTVPSSTTYTYLVAATSSSKLPPNATNWLAGTWNATVSGQTMTLTSNATVAPAIGQTIYSVAAGFVQQTIITKLASGTAGQNGATYTLSNSMTIGTAAAFSSIAKQMAMSKANTDISITGHGRLNGNFNQGGLVPNVNYNDIGVLLNNCINPYVGSADGTLKVHDTAYVPVSCCRAVHPIIENINVLSTEDGPHIFGPIFGSFTIKGITGSTADDGAVAEMCPAYNYFPLMPVGCGGSFYGGGLIEDVQLENAGNDACACFYISASAGGAPHAVGSSDFKAYGTYTARNIRQGSGLFGENGADSSVAVAGGYNNDVAIMDQLIVENAQGTIILGNPGGGSPALWLKKVVIKNHGFLSAGDYNVAIRTGSTSIRSLTVNDSVVVNPAGAGSWSYINFGPASTVNNLNINHIVMESVDGTGSLNLFTFNDNTSYIGNIFMNAPFIGNGAFLVNTGTYTPADVPCNIVIRDAENLVTNAVTVGNGNWTIFIDGGDIGNSSPFNIYGGTVQLSGANFMSAVGQNLFANIATGLTIGKWITGNAKQRAVIAAAGSYNLSIKTIDDSVVLISATPGTPLATFNLQFPANTSSIDGETRTVRFGVGVTTLASSGGTVLGLPTTVAQGYQRTFVYSAADAAWI